MRYKLHNNNAFVSCEKIESNAIRFWDVRLRAPNGELYDKVRCDDFRSAMDYWKSFNAIAKNL